MSGAKLLPEVVAGILREAVSKFLKLDPNHHDYLAPLEGKIISLKFTPLDFSIYLCPDIDSIDILPAFGAEPDVSLTGSPLAFARMGLSDNPRQFLFAGEIQVEGDMAVATAFQSLFERLQIPWETWLVNVTGASAGGQIARQLRGLHQWGLESLQTFGLNLTEFLQDESKTLPAEPEAAVFYGQVDELRSDLDRLEARVDRLLNEFKEPLN